MSKNIIRAVLLSVITLEALGALGAYPEIASDFTWLGLSVTTAAVWLAIEWLEAPSLIWYLALVGVVLDTGSSLLLLYSRIPFWDKPIHTFGGFAAGAGILELGLRAFDKTGVRGRRRWALLAAVVVLGTSFAGFLYEVLEYLVDRFHYGHPKTLVNAYNTIEDQLFNTLGSVLVLGAYGCIVWYKHLRWRHEKNPSRLRPDNRLVLGSYGRGGRAHHH